MYFVCYLSTVVIEYTTAITVMASAINDHKTYEFRWMIIYICNTFQGILFFFFFFVSLRNGFERRIYPIRIATGRAWGCSTAKWMVSFLVGVRPTPPKYK